MTDLILESEWHVLAQVAERDLIGLAVELDLVPPAQIEVRALWEQCVLATVDYARRNGLPFSKYDADDLLALPEADLQALARVLGVSPATPSALLKSGEKIYKTLLKQKKESFLAMLLPLMLSAVARAAHLSP